MTTKNTNQVAELVEARDLPFEVRMAGAEAITLEIMKAGANYDAACDCWDAMIAALASYKEQNHG